MKLIRFNDGSTALVADWVDGQVLFAGEPDICAGMQISVCRPMFGLMMHLENSPPQLKSPIEIKRPRGLQAQRKFWQDKILGYWFSPTERMAETLGVFRSRLYCSHLAFDIGKSEPLVGFDGIKGQFPFFDPKTHEANFDVL